MKGFRAGLPEEGERVRTALPEEGERVRQSSLQVRGLGQVSLRRCHLSCESSLSEKGYRKDSGSTIECLRNNSCPVGLEGNGWA